MKNLFILVASVTMLFSCNSESQKKYGTDKLSSVELSIEGMSCEKMCGGAIQKGLEKMDGVASTELEFSADNPIDKVTVQFDSDKISEAEMKSKVESLAKGAYKVTDVTEVGS